MEESEENKSAEDVRKVDSPSAVNKPKKRSLVERELETNMTSRVTCPAIIADKLSTSRYGRARRLKTDSELADAQKIILASLKSPGNESTPVKVTSPVYRMHASNSPQKAETPKKDTFLDSQIDNIYQENISLSRFSDDTGCPSPAKKYPKVYIRKDLIQNKEEDETIMLIKNLFSPTKSATKSSRKLLKNSLECSSEKYNNTKHNGHVDNASVVKTLDFDSNKKKKDNKGQKLSKNELFELEAKSPFQVGDLAWARMGTFPFWPCIITRDPNSEMFVKKKLFGRVEHDILHVTFFGDNGRRSWIMDNMLRKYLGHLEFEATKEKFTPEDKKKDPRLYTAFFISEKKQALWNTSVEEAETLLREPKRLRIDIFNDMLWKFRAAKKNQKSGKITRTNSDVSLSESLYDSLFSEEDVKTDDMERAKNRSKNKSFDVSEVVTACLDNMAAKTGITKIQRQSHMDRWLQKAKSKTPEKSQSKLLQKTQEKPLEKIQAKQPGSQAKQLEPPQQTLEEVHAKQSVKTGSKQLKNAQVKQPEETLAKQEKTRSNPEVVTVKARSPTVQAKPSKGYIKLIRKVSCRNSSNSSPSRVTSQKPYRLRQSRDSQFILLQNRTNEKSSLIGDDIIATQGSISGLGVIAKVESLAGIDHKQDTSTVILIDNNNPDTVIEPIQQSSLDTVKSVQFNDNQFIDDVKSIKHDAVTVIAVGNDNSDVNVPTTKEPPIEFSDNSVLTNDKSEPCETNHITMMDIDEDPNNLINTSAENFEPSETTKGLMEVDQGFKSSDSPVETNDSKCDPQETCKDYFLKDNKSSEILDNLDRPIEERQNSIEEVNDDSVNLDKPPQSIRQHVGTHELSEDYDMTKLEENYVKPPEANGGKYELNENIQVSITEVVSNDTVDAIKANGEHFEPVGQDFIMEVERNSKASDNLTEVGNNKTDSCELKEKHAEEVDYNFEGKAKEGKSILMSETVSNESMEDNKIEMTGDNCNVKSDTGLKEAKNFVTIEASVTETEHDDTINNEQEGGQPGNNDNPKPSQNSKTTVANIDFFGVSNSQSANMVGTDQVLLSPRNTSTPEKSNKHDKSESAFETINSILSPKLVIGRVLSSDSIQNFHYQQDGIDPKNNSIQNDGDNNVSIDDYICNESLTNDSAANDAINKSGNSESILQQHHEVDDSDNENLHTILESTVNKSTSLNESNQSESILESSQPNVSAYDDIGEVGSSIKMMENRANLISDLEENYESSVRHFVESPTFTQLLASEEFFRDVNEPFNNVLNSENINSSKVLKQVESSYEDDSKSETKNANKQAVLNVITDQNVDENFEDTSEDEPSPEYESFDEDIAEDFRKHMISIENNITDKKDEEQIVKICNEIAEKAKLSPIKYTTGVEVPVPRDTRNTAVKKQIQPEISDEPSTGRFQSNATVVDTMYDTTSQQTSHNKNNYEQSNPTVSNEISTKDDQTQLIDTQTAIKIQLTTLETSNEEQKKSRVCDEVFIEADQTNLIYIQKNTQPVQTLFETCNYEQRKRRIYNEVSTKKEQTKLSDAQKDTTTRQTSLDTGRDEQRKLRGSNKVSTKEGSTKLFETRKDTKTRQTLFDTGDDKQRKTSMCSEMSTKDDCTKLVDTQKDTKTQQTPLDIGNDEQRKLKVSNEVSTKEVFTEPVDTQEGAKTRQTSLDICNNAKRKRTVSSQVLTKDDQTKLDAQKDTKCRQTSLDKNNDKQSKSRIPNMVSINEDHPKLIDAQKDTKNRPTSLERSDDEQRKPKMSTKETKKNQTKHNYTKKDKKILQSSLDTNNGEQSKHIISNEVPAKDYQTKFIVTQKGTKTGHISLDTINDDERKLMPNGVTREHHLKIFDTQINTIIRPTSLDSSNDKQRKPKISKKMSTTKDQTKLINTQQDTKALQTSINISHDKQSKNIVSRDRSTKEDKAKLMDTQKDTKQQKKLLVPINDKESEPKVTAVYTKEDQTNLIDTEKSRDIKLQKTSEKADIHKIGSDKSCVNMNGDASTKEITDKTKKIYKTRSMNSVTKERAILDIRNESSQIEQLRKSCEFDPKVLLIPLEINQFLSTRTANESKSLEDTSEIKSKLRLSLRSASPNIRHTKNKTMQIPEVEINPQEYKNQNPISILQKENIVTQNKEPRKLNIKNSAIETTIPEPLILNGYHKHVNRKYTNTLDLTDDTDFDIETVSVNSEDTDISLPCSVDSVPKRNLRLRSENTLENALKNPEFLKYLELRQDYLMDEHPELNDDEVLSYVYKTWQYEEDLKSDFKTSNDAHNSTLIKAIKQETPSHKSNKCQPKKKIENHFRENYEKCKKTFDLDSEAESATFVSRESVIKQEIQLISSVDSGIENSNDKTKEVPVKRKTRSKSPDLVDLTPKSSNVNLSVKDISRKLDTVSIKVEETLTPKRTLRSKAVTPKRLEKDINEAEVKQSPDKEVKKEREIDYESIDSENSEVPLRQLRSKALKKEMISGCETENILKITPLITTEEPIIGTEIKNEINEIALTVSDNPSLKQKKKKTDKRSLDDPDFINYLEHRRDALMDENPQLTQDEIVSYLYKTWLYEEKSKSDMKKNDELEQANLIKGLHDNDAAPPKKVRRRPKTEQKTEHDSTPREKPKRRTIQPYYNENYSDLEDELEVFEIFKTKKLPIPVIPKVKAEKEKSKSPKDATKSKKAFEVLKTTPKTEEIIEVDSDLDTTKEEIEEIENELEYMDAIELYFTELTKPKPNVFKGLIREKICEICELAGNLVKCKGCNGMFHFDCIKTEADAIYVESLPPRGRKKKKIRKLKSLEDSESQSDEKSQNVSADNMSVDEIVPLEIATFDADALESQLSAKMKELIDIAETNYDSYSSDDGIDWKDTVAGKCEIVEVKLKRRRPPIDYNNFKCNNCHMYDVPICSVCKRAVSKTNVEKRQRCHVAHCYKYYHLECLDHWPQTQFNSGEPSKNNKKINEFFEALTCPRHVCHTCVSDDPRGCKTRFSGDKLAKCVRCPATYHSFNKCLPAGTQILTASHIICPRHLDQIPGRVPCHVNTGWCFICAQGGSLICCEYCPTSFHAECLNIKPPEGNYMCEDCETGRLPLYGEMVWVKLGHYRWWPAMILHPSEIPDNIMAAKHSLGEFVVRFFGQYDHYWVNRGRVFPYQEGDSGRISNRNSKIDADFTLAIEHAQRAYEILKNAEPNDEESVDIASSLLPPHYVKLKCNKPCGSLCGRKVENPSLSLTQCECNPDEPEPCGPYSQCLNRMLLTECGPTCLAGDRCNNRAFEKRLYPKLVPYRTPHRGWGLKTLEDIKGGQFVIEYVGELIDEEEFRRRMRRMHEIRDENFYFLTLDKERMIDAGPKGNLARFMNHCCEPNCETQKWTVLGDIRVGLFAIDDIPANSEVTFNYNLQCAGIEKKKCMCGAKRCSGYIGAKPKQDESQLKKAKFGKLGGKRTYRKKKTDESPSSSDIKPKRPLGRPRKPKELTEIEKDLLIIKTATSVTSSSESSRRQSEEDKKSSSKQSTEDITSSTKQIIEDKSSTRRQSVEDKKSTRRQSVEDKKSSRSQSLDGKLPKTLKRIRVSISTEEASLCNGYEPRLKKQKCEVGD